MTQQVWVITRGATIVTDDVMSFTYSTGRQTQFDSWAPGFLILTIRNESGQANAYDLNDKITLTADDSSFYQWLYVQEVLFNDMPGTGASSTATIICTDLLGRLGRIQVFQKSLAVDDTIEQIRAGFEALLPTGTSFATSTGNSQAAADTYTGTGLNRLNLNMTTEQGWVGVNAQVISLIGRGAVTTLLPATITFARSASGAYQMGYSNIQRLALGSNYLNTCTVTPPVAAPQNAADTAGVTAYGTYGTEFSTVDNTGSQALSFAQWQVFSRDDPNELSFQISVSDTANNFQQLFNAFINNYVVVTVSYRKPGSLTDLTSSQIMQGWSMSVTPSQTDMQIFTSPLTYTNFFILDSSTFGVLGGGGVTYNEAAVTYNQATYVYNQAGATAGSRLGW